MSKWLSIAAAAAVVSFTGFIHSQIEPTTQVDRGEAFVPSPAVAKVMAFGFDAAMADYHWLQAIQAVGGYTIVDAKVARHVGKLIDVVTTLDPWVDHPYRFAAVWMTEGEDNVLEANRLLERGIEHHPDDWRNWFHLGFNHFYFLREFEPAADALHEATLLDGSPVYLPRLVARLRSQTADIEVAEIFLRQVIASAEDEARVAQYQAALDEIEVERKARMLDRARSAYLQLHGRDIEEIDDLVRGDSPLLRRLPSPEPESLPSGLRRGSVWEIDAENGQIRSSYYGARYEVHYSPSGQMKRESEEVDPSSAHEGETESRGELGHG